MFDLEFDVDKLSNLKPVEDKQNTDEEKDWYPPW